MRKIYLANLLIVSFLLLSNLGFSGTFTSTSSGTWNNPVNWSFSGDSDGIPDSDDDVTILNTHQISIPSGSNYVRDLTINFGGEVKLIAGTSVLYIYGDYTNNGTESGTAGAISFKSLPGNNIDGTGTFSAVVKYTFAGTRNISSNVTFSKTGTVRFLNNVTLNNSGNVSFSSIYNGNNVIFTNQNNATLTIRTSNFLTGSGNVINASSPNNTVIVQYNNSTIPAVSASTFGNLTVNGNSLSLPSDVIVNDNFTINASHSLNMNHNLSVGGDFSNSGTFNQTNGTTTTLNGTSLQNLTSSGTTTFTDIVLNNAAGAKINSGTFQVTGSLTATNGNFNLGSGNLTLVSNSSATARLGTTGAGGSYSGSCTVQRFVSARSDGYSDMSSPVQNATFADWAADWPMIFGAYSSSFAPSAYTYDEPTNGYIGVPSSGTAISPGVGYEVYLDNDGSTSTSWVNTTLTLSGTPNFGDVNIAISNSLYGWNLIGNPYASFISWSTFRTNAGVSMTNQFQYWDETINGYAIGNLGDEIAPGQGFWIEATAAGTGKFHENNKTTSSNSSFRNSDELLFGLRINSEKPNSFTSNTYFRFDDYASEAYEQNHDLTFLKIHHPDAPAIFTTSSEGRPLVINELKGQQEMNIPIHFSVGVSGNYIISSNNIEMLTDAGYTCAVLEDTRTKQMFDLSSGNYAFYADANEKSERFILHLSTDGNACRMAQSESVADMMNVSGVEIVNRGIGGLFVNFQLEEMQNAVITVVNPLGQEIVNPISQKVQEQNVRIYLPAGYSGIYLINVRVGDKMITRKFYQ